jgi:hypothetical protein
VRAPLLKAASAWSQPPALQNAARQDKLLQHSERTRGGALARGSLPCSAAERCHPACSAARQRRCSYRRPPRPCSAQSAAATPHWRLTLGKGVTKGGALLPFRARPDPLPRPPLGAQGRGLPPRVAVGLCVAAIIILLVYVIGDICLRYLYSYYSDSKSFSHS